MTKCSILNIILTTTIWVILYRFWKKIKTEKNSPSEISRVVIIKQKKFYPKNRRKKIKWPLQNHLKIKIIFIMKIILQEELHIWNINNINLNNNKEIEIQ